MALVLVRFSIEVNQGGTLYARAKVSLVSWEGRSHVLLFMVPLGPPGVRPMAQVLRLPFEYYITIIHRKHLQSFILKPIAHTISAVVSFILNKTYIPNF